MVEIGGEALAILEAIDKAVAVLVAVGLMLMGGGVDGTTLVSDASDEFRAAEPEAAELIGLEAPDGVDPRTDEAGIELAPVPEIVVEGVTGVTVPERDTESVVELTGTMKPELEGETELTGTTEPVLEGVDPMIELAADDAPEATDDTTLPTTLVIGVGVVVPIGSLVTWLATDEAIEPTTEVAELTKLLTTEPARDVSLLTADVATEAADDAKLATKEVTLLVSDVAAEAAEETTLCACEMTLLAWETTLLTTDVIGNPVGFVADTVGLTALGAVPVPVPEPEIPDGLTCEALAAEGVDAALGVNDALEPPTTILRPTVTPEAGLLAAEAALFVAEAEAGVALLTRGVTPPPLDAPPVPVAGGDDAGGELAAGDGDGDAADGAAEVAAGDGLLSAAGVLAGAEEPPVARLEDMMEPALPFVTTETTLDATLSPADTASETIVSVTSPLVLVSLDARLLVTAGAVAFANGVTCRLMALGK